MSSVGGTRCTLRILEVRAVPVMGIGCISVIPHETMFTGSAQEKSSGLLSLTSDEFHHLPVSDAFEGHYCIDKGNPKARTQVTCFVACLRYHQAAGCTSSLPWSAAFCNQPLARASRGGVIPRLMSRRSTFAIVFPNGSYKYFQR